MAEYAVSAENTSHGNTETRKHRNPLRQLLERGCSVFRCFNLSGQVPATGPTGRAGKESAAAPAWQPSARRHPRDEYVRPAGYRRRDDPFVAGVAEPEAQVPRGRLDHGGFPQQRFDFVDGLRGQLQRRSQCPAKFLQDHLSDHELVLKEDVREEISAQPSRGERRDQDVGVEEDLHDTSRKTSSSVR